MKRISIVLLYLMAPALAWGGVWSEQVANAPHELVVIDAVTAEIAWAAGTAGVVIRTVDGGVNWELVPAPSYDFRALSARDAMRCVVGDAGGRLFRTTDGGAHWDLVAYAQGSFIDGIHFFDDLHGWAVGDPVGGRFVILESSDGGATWLPSPGAPAAVGPVGGYVGSFGWIGSTIGAFGTNQWVVWRTTDGGASWDPITTHVHYVSALVLDESEIALAGGTLSALDRSTDSGATWSLIGSPTEAPFLAFSWVEASPVVWGMTGQQHAHFQSTDSGITWTLYSFPSNYVAEDIDFVADGSGWSVGCLGSFDGPGRVWRYDPGLVTAITEPLQISEPSSLRVGPNPFSTTATFIFEGGRRSPIAIWDVAGREVRRLESVVGSAAIVWNGRDAGGQPVPAGVYFYQVTDAPRGAMAGRLVRAR